ncbi:MAG: hypothetical protein ACP5SI_12670, partial [Chloroflexia bacterium]
FLTACAVPTGHGLLHLLIIARPYLHTLRTSLERQRLPVDLRTAGLVLALGVGGAAALFSFRPKWLRALVRVEKSNVRHGLALLWLLLVIVCGPVRMAVSPARIQVEGEWFPNFDRLSFLRLGWYLSPPGLLLGIAGVWWWLSRRLEETALPFFLAFFLQFALYTYRTFADPYHFWMMRRYLPLVFPVLSIGAAVAVWRVRMAPLGRAVRRGGALLLVALLLFLFVRADAPFASRREMAGTAEALAVLAARIPKGAPLLIEHFGPALATPLRYLYGKEAYALVPPAPFEGRRTREIPWGTLWSVLEEWPLTDTVYLLLEHAPSLYRAGFSIVEEGRFTLDTRTTETSYDHLPRAEVEVRSSQALLRVRRLQDAPEAFYLRLAEPKWTGVCTGIEVRSARWPMRLRIEAAGFRPQGVSPAHLTVLWQGEPIGRAVLEPTWAFEELTFELRLSGEVGRLEVCSDTWAPQEFGFSGPVGEVGILLRSLMLEEDR